MTLLRCVDLHFCYYGAVNIECDITDTSSVQNYFQLCFLKHDKGLTKRTQTIFFLLHFLYQKVGK
jgi:hypothetical protein